MTTPPTGYTTREAAAASLGCSLSKVQRMIDQGVLSAKKIEKGKKPRTFVQIKSVDKVRDAMAVLDPKK